LINRITAVAHDHQQIHVAVLARFTSGVGAEKYDAFRRELPGKRLNKSVNVPTKNHDRIVAQCESPVQAGSGWVAGHNALVFKNRDSADLATKIRLLADSPDLLQKLQSNARCLRTISQDDEKGMKYET